MTIQFLLTHSNLVFAVTEFWATETNAIFWLTNWMTNMRCVWSDRIEEVLIALSYVIETN